MTSLVDHALGDLALWEGVVLHPYLDTKGLVTIAIGHLLKTPDDAAALPLTVRGKPADDYQKRAAWEVVKRLPAARADSWYASATAVRLSQEQCFALARGRLEGEFLPRLRAKLPGFDGFPLPVQRAITDIAWNYGTAGLFKTKSMFPRLLAHDWKGAAAVSQLLSSRPLRNEWRAARFAEAAG